MSIPLPEMLRQLRRRQYEDRLGSATARVALRVWAFLARRPRLYRPIMDTAVRALAMLGRRKGRFRQLPFAGGWTQARDLPAPQGASFQTQWRKRRTGNGS